MRKIILSAIIILSLLGAHTAFAGFGVTPPYVRNDTLTRGSDFTKKITLVRGDPLEDLKAEITLNIPGATGWFSVDRGTEFILPAGEKNVPILVTVRVPENAEYGEYTGNIRVRTSSLAEKSGVSIALGAQIDVLIRVVDRIYDFEVRRVEIQDAEEGRRKWWLDYPGRVTFLMHVENTGNAPVAPSRVDFKIYSRQDKQLLETVSNIGAISEVQPFDTTKVAAYLPTFLPPGGYNVEYTIYKNELVARSGDVSLSVLPRGVLPGYEPFGFEGLSFGDKASIIVPIVMFLLIILGVLLWIVFGGSHRPRRKRSSPISRKPTTPIDRTQPISRVNPQIQRRPSSGNVIDLSRRR
jgi:hypothetical protein